MGRGCIQSEVSTKLEKNGISKDSYHFWLRPYGYNGVSGMDVPEGYVPE